MRPGPLAFVLAFVAGALVTLQIGSNARLKEALGGALPAIIVSSAPGVGLLSAAMLVLQVPWPSTARLTAAPPSAWAAGCGLMVGGFFLIWKF